LADEGVSTCPGLPWKDPKDDRNTITPEILSNDAFGDL
jgi:hypothetical protein